MKVLITGGSGLLGRYLLRTKPNDVEIALTWYENIKGAPETSDPWYKLDIRDRQAVFDLFEATQPNLVIHCAAVGSVDYAQSDHGYQSVFEVNVTGTSHIIDACNGYKSKLVYISTNAVYGGDKPPYDEISSLQPVNSYGAIKVTAERVVKDKAKRWMIIRPFLLYGWPWPGGRTNWAVKLIERVGDKSYKLVHDHIWQPTYAGDVAEAIWKLSEQDNQIYNVAAMERATLFEFGLKVCNVFGLEIRLIEPVDSNFFPTIAPRPKDTTYDLKKLVAQGIMLSDIRTGLEKMRGE
jgi:dTDP-4-dehydrorhamnose reductase